MRELGFDAADIPGAFYTYGKAWFFTAQRGLMAEIHFAAEPGGARDIKPGLLSMIELSKKQGFIGVLGVVATEKRSVIKLCQSIGLDYLDSVYIRRADTGATEQAEIYYKEFRQ